MGHDIIRDVGTDPAQGRKKLYSFGLGKSTMVAVVTTNRRLGDSWLNAEC
jgi:hypothetical protein